MLVGPQRRNGGEGSVLIGWAGEGRRWENAALGVGWESTGHDAMMGVAGDAGVGSDGSGLWRSQAAFRVMEMDMEMGMD